MKKDVCVLIAGIMMTACTAVSAQASEKTEIINLNTLPAFKDRTTEKVREKYREVISQSTFLTSMNTMRLMSPYIGAVGAIVLTNLSVTQIV